jgi:acetyl-CoA carboxylase carboxyl transferase subunit alpha
VICDEFQELAGDRAFADDNAIVGGLARIDGRPDGDRPRRAATPSAKVRRNFGMPARGLPQGAAPDAWRNASACRS